MSDQARLLNVARSRTDDGDHDHEPYYCNELSNANLAILEDLYYTQRLSQSEVAKQFGVSKATVVRWMRDEELSTRPRGPKPRTNTPPPETQ